MPRMLPGETVVHRLRPSAWSFAPLYGVAAVQALAALPLAWLLGSPGWRSGSQGSPWLFWHYLYGNGVADALVAGLLLAAGTVAFAAVARARPAVLAAGFGLDLLAVAGAALGGSAALPWAVMATGLLSGIVAETHRRLTLLYVTTFRVWRVQSWLSPGETQARLVDVADLDGRQGPVARLFGSGTLVAVLKGPLPKESFRGVHPFPRMRELVEVLVQEAAASPGLQREHQTRERKARLLAELGATP
ncbi:MAG: hypothetical protein ACYDBQ_00855 [Thermoplasmatota archaeon]